jgi:hypothetical protein
LSRNGPYVTISYGNYSSYDKIKNIARVRNFEFTDEKYNIVDLVCTNGNYAQERIT